MNESPWTEGSLIYNLTEPNSISISSLDAIKKKEMKLSAERQIFLRKQQICVKPVSKIRLFLVHKLLLTAETNMFVS